MISAARTFTAVVEMYTAEFTRYLRCADTPISVSQTLWWLVSLLCLALSLALPDLALGQSPFEEGATNLVDELTAIAVPIAVLAVMALGIAAIVGLLSWSWPVFALLGIGIVFGASQIVDWIRGMFNV